MAGALEYGAGMKRFSLILLLAGPVLALAADAPTNAPVACRFKLVPAVVTTATNASVVEKPGLFKIDTATGRTWRLVSAIRDGHLMENWKLIED